MIPVAPVAEPRLFDAQCRTPGRDWLQRNPDAKRPRDYWTPFKAELHEGFKGLCGYGAMFSPVGSVDHYVSWKNDKSVAYEWDNYRFAEEWINKSKQTADSTVLDPYKVGRGWFEVLLPSLQLRVAPTIPSQWRDIAQFTIERLHLIDDERVLRQRRAWYALYQQGDLTLRGLDAVAPLIADAVRRAE